jgi:hypothetical protein
MMISTHDQSAFTAAPDAVPLHPAERPGDPLNIIGEQAVIEHVAADMLESRTEHVEDRTPWDKAGYTWQTAFREMAVAARQA